MKRKFTKILMLGASLIMSNGLLAQNPLWKAYGNNPNFPKGYWHDIKIASATNVLISGRDFGGYNYPVIRGFGSTMAPLNMLNSGQRFTSLNSSQRVYSISMDDNTNGWAIYTNNNGDQAYLLNSTNAGVNWSLQQTFTGTAVGYATICRVDATIGFVYIEGSTIKKTIDGGANFTDQTLPGNPFIPKIYFFNDQIGWILGFSGQIYSTTNGGANWVAQSSGVTTPLKNAHFISSTEGWVVGNNNVILHTTDGGATWTPQTITTTNVTTINDVHFTSATTGYVVGNYLLRGFTTDGGSTWNVESYNPATAINEYTALDFLTPSLGLTVDVQGFIYKYCPGYTVNTSFTTCEGSMFGNQSIYTSGTYTEYFQSIGGCDSIVTANITVVPAPTTGTDVQTVCGSYTWIDGVTYTASTNSPYFMVQNAYGCDSLVNLNLTINTMTAIDEITSCDYIIWLDGQAYNTSNNTATYTIPGINGCDTLVTLNYTNLSESIDNTITLSGNTLTAQQSGATYQWFECITVSPYVILISGATSQSFTPTQSGSYYLEIYMGGCIRETTCTQVTIGGGTSSINESSVSSFTLYPNPTNNMVNLENLKAGSQITVYDVTGKVVYSEIVESTVSVISTSDWENGIYLVETSFNGIKQQTKLVVSK